MRRRILVPVHRGATVFAVGATLAMSLPVPAAAQVRTTASAHVSAVTAPMTRIERVSSDAHPVAVSAPDGRGSPVPGDCGTAQLTVDASTKGYQIALHSTAGVIGSGFYSVRTNGIGSLPTAGNINGRDSTIWVSDRGLTVFDPGLRPTTATVTGVVFTAGATCGFVASAPWT